MLLRAYKLDYEWKGYTYLVYKKAGYFRVFCPFCGKQCIIAVTPEPVRETVYGYDYLVWEERVLRHCDHLVSTRVKPHVELIRVGLGKYTTRHKYYGDALWVSFEEEVDYEGF